MAGLLLGKSDAATFEVAELVRLPLGRKGRIVGFHHGGYGTVAIVAVGKRGVLRGFFVPDLRKYAEAAAAPTEGTEENTDGS